MNRPEHETCPDLARLRLAIDGLAPDAELAAHLATCPACAAALAAEREFAADLRAALTPAPLSAAFQRRLAADVARTRRRVYALNFARWSLPLAAALGLAVLWSPYKIAEPTRAPGAVASAPRLSADDAAVLVQGLTALDWEGAPEYMLSSVTQQVNAACRVLETSSSRTLPWDSSEDWDAPQSESRGAPHSSARPQTLS